jgi:cyclase
LKRARIIPVLLLRGNGLYKTRKFKKPIYIGDPINAVKIFSEKEVDEIILLDIDATVKKKSPNYQLIEDIASECFVPLTYGGGITSTEQFKTILSLGVEKIAINSALFFDNNLVNESASIFGAQSIVASVDVRKRFWGYSAYTHRGKVRVKMSLSQILNNLKSKQIGEILLNSIDNDGTMNGYDLDLIEKVSSNSTVPVTACGGCSDIDNFRDALKHGASAVAAGSLFVFKGSRNSVLINYPTQSMLKESVFSTT